MTLFALPFRVRWCFCFPLLTALFTACQQSKEVQKVFSNDGKLQQEVEYENGVPNGKQTTYYPSGKVKAVSFLKNGQPDSLSTGYYEDGKTRFARYYRNGLLEGPFKNFHENGNLIGSGTYRGGKRAGYAYDYFREEPGKVKKKTYFYNFQGKETIGSVVAYQKDGRVYEEKPGKVLVKAPADTLRVGQPVDLEVSLSDADQELQAVVLGQYDDQFRLADSLSLDTTKATSRKIVVRYTPTRAGLQPIRGSALVRLMVQYSGRTQTTTVKPIYFEHPLYAK
ncbi:MAG: toxin-antitoxin system YwqK family antitoxin [Ferruginibacter sp.]|nr:toxin-antitoxin system YwqK family antitoxin [Cytophagales bacterium]